MAKFRFLVPRLCQIGQIQGDRGGGWLLATSQSSRLINCNLKLVVLAIIVCSLHKDLNIYDVLTCVCSNQMRWEMVETFSSVNVHCPPRRINGPSNKLTDSLSYNNYT